MSALIKSLRVFNRINHNPAAIYTIVRKAGDHWNKDYKPGPLPTTEEERRAAAKKYGLLPEEYKTYENDGSGYGDYPRLDEIPIEQRDQHYPYDFPEMRRNFQEPVHAEVDYYDETRVGTPAPLRWSFGEMFFMFFAVVGGFMGLFYILEDPNKKMFQPAMPKALYGDGKKHYTFEPAR